MSESKKDPKLTLVGAGPVGSLLAAFLARRGYDVDVLERRPDMRKKDIGGGRSINLAVSVRGIHALNQLGIDQEVLKQAVAMKGRMMHSVGGELTFQPYGMDDSQCIYSISRAGLNKTLMSFAEETGRVRFHFEKRVSGVKLAERLLEVVDESGPAPSSGHPTEFPYDVLIGTDGSASAIRQSMSAQPGFQLDQSRLDYGYKELVIPPSAQGGFSMEKNALHIWPRGAFMLIALPNWDGSYTCTLFLPFEGPVSFASLDSREKVGAFFSEQFSDALPLIENLTESFFSNPTGQMVTVRCSPWNYESSAMLLGDAAHAIVPFFGQGMNCGFEDCTILDQALADFTGNWAILFAEFGGSRKPDSDAIADMAIENFTEMRDKVGDQRFLLEKAVEKVLQTRFGGEYRSRYSLVTFSRVPYRLALKAGEIEASLLSELCQDIQSPENVDMDLAGELIKRKLSPLWARELGKNGTRT